MATTHKTIYTHTCDFCGAEKPRGELYGFGRVPITEADRTMRNPAITGDPVDVCKACQQRPMTELVEKLDNQPKRDRFGNRA